MTPESSIEVLISYFENLIPLSNKEKELVRQKFSFRIYRKRQYVLQEGDVCTRYNFVVKGCLRMYKMDDKGNVHILKFANENSWVTDLVSFYDLETSLLNIDALEQTVVLQISRDDMIFLCREAPKFDRIFRILTAFMAVRQKCNRCGKGMQSENVRLEYQRIYVAGANRKSVSRCKDRCERIFRRQRRAVYHY